MGWTRRQAPARLSKWVRKVRLLPQDGLSKAYIDIDTDIDRDIDIEIDVDTLRASLRPRKPIIELVKMKPSVG